MNQGSHGNGFLSTIPQLWIRKPAGVEINHRTSGNPQPTVQWQWHVNWPKCQMNWHVMAARAPKNRESSWATSLESAPVATKVDHPGPPQFLCSAKTTEASLVPVWSIFAPRMSIHQHVPIFVVQMIWVVQWVNLSINQFDKSGSS